MQDDFRYDSLLGVNTRYGANVTLSVSIFANRPRLRSQLADDAIAAGLIIAEQSNLEDLASRDFSTFGDLVMIDCPSPDAGVMATLAKIDIHASNKALPLIISTTVEGVDAVFGCVESKHAQILVDPTETDRAIALGILLSSAYGNNMRELGDSDRLLLVRLTEQVNRMAERIERLDGRGRGRAEDGGVFRFESPATAYDNELVNNSALYPRSTVPVRPDAGLIKNILRNRRMRNEFFEGELFADPAWDMLLDLSLAALEGVRVSVSSLCIAAAVPPTTALRWIGQMVEAGLFERVEDENDKRRVFIQLSVKSEMAMAGYFGQISSSGGLVI